MERVGTNPFQRAVLGTFSFVFRTASGAFLCLIILLLLPYALSYVHNAESFPFVQSILDAEQRVREPLYSLVRTNLPTRVGGKDITLLLVILPVFAGARIFANLGARLSGRASYLRYREEMDHFMTERNIPEDNAAIREMNKEVQQLNPEKKKDREKLLEIFADTKRKLDEMGRTMAFLSIDIVDSTGMKIGEDHSTIEHDFKQYKKFLMHILENHGALKSAWTPDGVMISFRKIQDAVRAAKEVIRSLPDFNRTIKLMNRDFIVRCGANEGFVYLDDSLPLEEVSDRVIDIAGHMQKHAAPGSLFLPEPAAGGIENRSDIGPEDREIDGFRVYSWRDPAATEGDTGTTTVPP